LALGVGDYLKACASRRERRRLQAALRRVAGCLLRLSLWHAPVEPPALVRAPLLSGQAAAGSAAAGSAAEGEDTTTDWLAAVCANQTGLSLLVRCVGDVLAALAAGGGDGAQPVLMEALYPLLEVA
jgi:hypothetical protein